MSTIKILAVAGVSAWMLFGNHEAQAQIPVTDGASIAQNMANQIQTIAQWTMQIEHMLNQIEQLDNQIEQLDREYESMTGGRGLGTIMNDPRYREYLPTEWQGVYDTVRNGGYAGLSGRAYEIHNENQVFDGCAHIQVNAQQLACEARAVKGAQDKAFALDAYDAARDRLTQIDQLMARINSTQDPKDIQELQGRIAAEQAMIANEQTKLQMYAMVAEAEDRLQEQREQEMVMEEAAKRGGLNVEPMNFSLRR
ncbi:P-type DNA transfer protein VirB5 [Halopseudomonas sp. SMJS2]|uniref:P-type DNA transfer protein VirB5 n=1 Tax=Halopseudomonas sp. SMJS2 TaxID=3041098 RepID=UPI002452875F|nr:P-type DNA transfer protein VirB5 [Halopseudomonas sp. SMJS2]WGK61339.1 P-type DNA transfer protein VirB5 [Halopseudomonas sp. SMJS2]